MSEPLRIHACCPHCAGELEHTGPWTDQGYPHACLRCGNTYYLPTRYPHIREVNPPKSPYDQTRYGDAS